MEKEFIVAIELGSSKISGIAGKRNPDGTMQVLAYASEKTPATCIKRGMVYNIDKTTQGIGNIINKLQTSLKAHVLQVYVGVGGQSVRSYKCQVKRNMLAKSTITGEIIDSMRDESYTIPYSDCEVLENFPQEYTVDQSVVSDPVGVIGENVMGEYLDIIARNTIKDNIRNCFANANVGVVEELLAPCQLANNVLTDAEKRSGCALVDFGAGTTTVVVCKSGIIRHLATIPLGQNNITLDLRDIFQLEESEAEDVKIRFGNASIESITKKEEEETEPHFYVTSDGRQINILEIQKVIEARVCEILDNVRAQIARSTYGDKLLAGIIVTGGGSNMKDIDKAIISNTKIDKIRIAKGISSTTIICGHQTGFQQDNAMNNTLIALLLAGSVNCGGEEFSGTSDLFVQQARDDDAKKKRDEMQAAANAEAEASTALKEIVDQMRTHINNITAVHAQLSSNRKDKKIRTSAEELCQNALAIFDDEKYTCSLELIEGKDKFRQQQKETSEIVLKMQDEVEKLQNLIAEVKKENSFFGKFKSVINTMMEDE